MGIKEASLLLFKILTAIIKVVNQISHEAGSPYERYLSQSVLPYYLRIQM